MWAVPLYFCLDVSIFLVGARVYFYRPANAAYNLRNELMKSIFALFR